MNRRTFVKAGAAVAATGLGIVGYTVGIEPHWLQIVRRNLVIANLPGELEGATLAQVSDLHVCSYVSDAYLTRSLDRLAQLKPDIVAFTGDLVTWEESRSRSQQSQLADVLQHLPRGRLATVGIPGNHDYGATWRDPRVAAMVLPIAERAGIRMLRNEVQEVSGLDVIGIDDLWSGRADTARAIAGRSSAAAVALCHNPDALDQLQWADYEGWVLAGHTHGGQCKPPFLPPPVLPVRNRRYAAGEVSVDSKRTLYINRGVGHLLKARFNVRPEITLFTLRGVRQVA